MINRRTMIGGVAALGVGSFAGFPKVGMANPRSFRKIHLENYLYNDLRTYKNLEEMISFYCPDNDYRYIYCIVKDGLTCKQIDNFFNEEIKPHHRYIYEIVYQKMIVGMFTCPYEPSTVRFLFHDYSLGKNRLQSKDYCINNGGFPFEVISHV